MIRVCLFQTPRGLCVHAYDGMLDKIPTERIKSLWDVAKLSDKFEPNTYDNHPRIGVILDDNYQFSHFAKYNHLI